MSLEIPQSPEMITAEWLSTALAREISTVQITRIGEDEGFTGGGLFRVSFDCGSVVAKLSPENAKLRASFAAANAREVQFYQMSAGLNLPVPACFYGDFDPATGASALLIEDMGARRSVPFLSGCEADDVGSVVDALARAHSAFWGSERIANVPSLALLDEFDFAKMWEVYPSCLAALLPDVALPEWFITLGDWIAADTNSAFEAMMQGPQTVVHRDAQVDNVLFSAGDAILLDWQFMGKGKGVHDLAFFLISSLAPDVRRRCEAEMVARYHTALGVAGYSFDDCSRDFGFGAIWRLFISVMATTQLDNSSPHKQAWRRVDLERLVAFCEDHEIGSRMFDALTEG